MFKVNLDTMEHSELTDYIVNAVDFVNENGGECHHPDLILMLDYAQLRQECIEARQRGDITQAAKMEDYCEDIYKKLPLDWRW